jgi:FlaG/FlaF family flagellin (archaellin)
MSEPVDTSLPGVEYDEEYDDIELENEMFTDDYEVWLEHTSGREIFVSEENGKIVAVEIWCNEVDYISVYDTQKVSIEAVAKFYANPKGWRIGVADDSVDVEEGDW